MRIVFAKQTKRLWSLNDRFCKFTPILCEGSRLLRSEGSRLLRSTAFDCMNLRHAACTRARTCKARGNRWCYRLVRWPSYPRLGSLRPLKPEAIVSGRFSLPDLHNIAGGPLAHCESGP